MSLNRVSYLESWVHNPASFRRRESREQSPGAETDDDDDDLAYQDLPDASLSSSFPSTYSNHSFRQRLNFNPYSGPGWSQAAVDDVNNDSISPRRSFSETPTQNRQNETAREEPVPQVKQQACSGLETIGAFEIGRTKRIVQVCLAILYCFFSAGIVFGFAALKPILIQEGVYRDRCSKGELEQDQEVCYGQEIHLNLMFTIAAVATNVCALPVGTILDTYGPHVSGIIGCIFLTFGSLLFGLAPNLPFDAVDVDIQDRHEGERQRNDRRVHRQNIVSKIQDLLTDGDDDLSVIHDPVLGTTNLNESNANPEVRQTPKLPADTHTTGGVWGALHGLSALQQISSAWFVLITLFTVLQMLRINYFVASLRQQYEYLFSSVDSARKLNESFDFLLPIGGLISVPFIGTILDIASTPFVLLVLVTTATVIGVLGCIPNSLHAGYANIILFVLYRPFYYTLVSDYAAKVFGFQTFGKVYGLIICLAGLGNFAQAGLDALTFKVFHRNPVPVNIVLTILTFFIGTALVGFVWWKAKAMAAAGSVADTSGQEATLESGTLPNGRHDSSATRDWEREPLLHRRLSPANQHGETPSYGVADIS
ncbi:putative MFS transporter Fmp42 [Aspergillus tanneri]|uniref:MFS transporter Fmp42 n=1 Tax=Aspergillus tanneri TaxID=1220188 RepID=A0A5M9MHR3_9EURO|nr:uncharacterized protein ATNIH1004_006775 [Aspergillus tanneri]KAA8645356.1 hypothetical protein ATNIH1004_006775 [Aspergillus tanneri]